jgi:hypothetical protein
MRKFTLSIQMLACAAASCLVACSSDDDDADASSTTEANQPNELSFFVTSSTQDGNLGGLSGADDICQELADAVGAGDKDWAAYLSAANSGQPIHARTRIGEGPWFNALGMMVAADLTALHELTGNADLFVTETGEKVNGQWNGANGMGGNPVNEHDIVTGSGPDGMLMMTDMATTCNDWTSNEVTPGPQVGHSDGMGPGMATDMPRFISWNGGHATQGCSSALLAPSGSTGRFYCFASN